MQVKPYTGRRHGKMVFIAGYSRQERAHRGAAPAERMGGGEQIVDLMDSADAKGALADFGFRHVYWGEYARSQEGAQVIGKVMDAFRALATVLGLPPAGITLNHRLGLYFTGLPGLDWSGRYDPSQVEIQIEKGSGGATTLAHEWGHFLDHMLDQVGRGKDPTDFQSYTSQIADQARKNRKNPHLPDHVRKQPLTPIQAAVARILDIARTARYGNNLGQSDTMIGWAKKYASELADKRAPSRYWTRPTELFARAFEAYVDRKEHAQLADPKTGLVDFNSPAVFFDASHHRSVIFPRGEVMAAFVEAFDNLFRLLKEDHFFEKALSMLKAMPPVHKMTRAAYADWLEEHELPKKPPRRRGVDPVKWRANIQEAIDHARGKRATISPDNVLAYDKMAAASRNDAAAKGKQAKASASEARMRKTGNLEFDRHGRVYYGPEHPDTINTGFRPAIASIQHPGKPARYAVGTEEAMRRHFSTASKAVKSGRAAGTLGTAPHRLTTYASQDKAQEHYKRLVAAVPSAREARERQIAETATPEVRQLYKSSGLDRVWLDHPFYGKETVGEYLERHKITGRADGRYQLYHATPNRSLTTLRAGSYLAEDPEFAAHQAARDRGLKRSQIKVHRLWLHPDQIEPGSHPTLRTDVEIGKVSKSAATDFEPPDDGPNAAEVKWWVAGKNKLHYPAFYNPLTNILRIVEREADEDDEDPDEIDKPNLALPERALAKSASGFPRGFFIAPDGSLVSGKQRTHETIAAAYLRKKGEAVSPLPAPMERGGMGWAAGGPAIHQMLTGGHVRGYNEGNEAGVSFIHHPTTAQYAKIAELASGKRKLFWDRHNENGEVTHTGVDFDSMLERIPHRSGVRKALTNPSSRLLWFPARADMILAGLCPDVQLIPGALEKALLEKAVGAATPPKTTTRKLTSPGMGSKGEPKQPKGKGYFSGSEISEMNLKWITVHPNGPGSEGQPILVHDNGQHYVVVGGAGGAMNQLTLKKDASHYQEVKKQKSEGKAKRQAQADQMAKEQPEEFQRLQNMRAAAVSKASEHMEALRQMTDKILQQNRADTDAKVRQQAEAHAKQLSNQLGSDKGIDPETLKAEREKAEALPAKAKAKRLDQLNRAEQGLTAFSDDDIKEFGNQAVAQAHKEEENAQRQILNAACFQLADAIQNGRDPTQGHVTVQVAGKTVNAKFSGSDMMEAARQMAGIAEKRAAEKAIIRALNTGRYDILGGMTQGFLDHTPSDTEVKKWVEDRQLNRASVKANVRLVTESEQASASRQRRSQAQGAADTLNGLVNDSVGTSVTTPETAHILGPEDTARVAAAYMRKGGVNTNAKAKEMDARIAQTNYASVVSALSTASDLRSIGKKAMQSASDTLTVAGGPGGQFKTSADVEGAAKELGLSKGEYDTIRSPDGFQMRVSGKPAIGKAKGAGYEGSDEPADVTFAQAGVVARTMGAERLRRLNVARGEMRAAAALSSFLHYDPDQPMAVHGGETIVEATLRARQLGLKAGQYRTSKRAGGGIDILVDPENVHLLAQPAQIKEAQRGVEKHDLVEEVRDRIRELGPAAYVNPDLQDGTETDAQGKQIGSVALLPHQILGVKAIMRFKHEILNHGAGSGKTATYLAAMSEMMREDPSVRGVLTMPAKPKGQQAERNVEEWEPAAGPNGEGGWVKSRKTGEIRKFLKSSVGQKIIVVRNGKHLQKAIEQVKSGEANFLVMTPELMRDYSNQLVKEGFADPEHGAFIGDEAHEYATGVGDAASDKARAARKFAGANHVVLGSGTLIEKNGCIAANTSIEDPVRNETRTVAEWMALRIAPYVWALNDRGERVVAEAGVPFVKDFDRLFEVTTADQNTVEVGSEHRFLTPTGWKRLSQLCPGDRIAVAGGSSLSGIASRDTRASAGAPVSPRPRGIASIPASSPMHYSGAPARWFSHGEPRRSSRGAPPTSERHGSHTPGARRCLGTGEGFQFGYSPYPHLRGEPPLRGSESGPGVSPSPADALERNPAGWRAGDRAGRATNSRRPSADHFRTASDRGLYTSRLGNQSASYTDCSIEWSEITNIEDVGEGAIYDLEVAEWHNYLAHGIWHHNSDLHSLVDFVAPGALGGKRKFMEQWERLAQQRASGGSGFAVEKMAAMKRMLSPYMTSYHQSPTREGGGSGEFVREDPEIRVVETPPEVRKQIIAINEDFKQAMASGNEGQRREAALRRDGRVNRALLGAHVAEAVKADLTAALAKPTKAGNGTLPARALIWSQEIGPNSPLAKVRKALGPEVMKHIVQITGDDNEKKTQTSARRLNDMTNDVVGCLMSNAANYGLNLQGASHIFMLGLPSTQQRQIIARALRFGQRRDKVKAVNYISDHLFHQLQARRTLKERAASVDLLSELQDKPMGMAKSVLSHFGSVTVPASSLATKEKLSDPGGDPEYVDTIADDFRSGSGKQYSAVAAVQRGKNLEVIDGRHRTLGAAKAGARLRVTTISDAAHRYLKGKRFDDNEIAAAAHTLVGNRKAASDLQEQYEGELRIGAAIDHLRSAGFADGVKKSLVDERGMWGGEKRFWIKPNGDSIEIPKEHEDWLRAHREDPQVKDAFPTKKTHFDNYDVEDFARKTGWSRSRHWASDGKMEHSYSLPNTSRKTFDAVQVHHSLMSPNEPGYATLQVEKKEGLGGAIHYHDVPAGEDDWKSSFDRARVAGMTKAIAAAEPDEGNGASETDGTDDTDASAGQDQGQDAVTVSGGSQRTGMQQQALQETVQALLGDESGAGEVLAQHWGTIVKAAGSVSPDLESGGGPAGFGDDERTEQFGKSGWQPARAYRRYRPAAAGAGAGAGAGRPAHSALIFRVAAAR